MSITTVAKASDVEQRRLLQRRSQRRHQIKPPLTQDECLAELRKHVEKAPIPPIQKKTLTNITKASTDIHKTEMSKSGKMRYTYFLWFSPSLFRKSNAWLTLRLCPTFWRKWATTTSRSCGRELSTWWSENQKTRGKRKKLNLSKNRCKLSRLILRGFLILQAAVTWKSSG